MPGLIQCWRCKQLKFDDELCTLCKHTAGAELVDALMDQGIIPREATDDDYRPGEEEQESDEQAGWFGQMFFHDRSCLVCRPGGKGKQK